jgi:hypothetical protein
MVENLKFLLSPFDTMADETEDPATELGEGTLNTISLFPFHILEGNTNIDIFLFIELNRVRGKTTKLLNNLGENFFLENFNIFIFSVTYFVLVL